MYYIIERNLCRTTPTILCNLCMVEDQWEKVILNTAHLKKTPGLANFSRWPYRKKESLVESVIREIYERQDLQLQIKTGRSQRLAP